MTCNPEIAADALAQMPMGAGVVALPELRILAANARLAARLGAGDGGALQGTSLAEAGGELASRLVSLVERVAAEGAPIEADLAITDGHDRAWVTAHAAPLRRPDGSIYAVTLLLVDITQRKRAEEDLRESETKAWAAIESAVEGVIIIDTDGIIESFNTAAERIFGYAREEVVGQNVSMLMPEPYRSQHTRFIHRYLETGEAHIIGIGREVVGQRKDGSVFPMDLAVSEVRLPDHRHFVGLMRDITKRKEAEEALHAARRQVEEAFRRELHIAKRFQSALLPGGDVRVPGYAIAHSYRPALEEADVGGDFYNLFEMDEGRAGIVVGDVGGKGLEAAVLAARAQNAILALALQDPLRPDRVLAAARRPVSAFDPDRILTVFLGILERESGRLVCASAGHEPPFLWHAREKRLETLVVEGPAMFDFPAGGYDLRNVTLEEGDVLFLYTDGLPDAKYGKERLGRERVAAVVATAAEGGPEAMLNAAFRAAMEHSDGRLRDDIVLMAIQRAGARHPEGEFLFVVPPVAPEQGR